VKQWNPSSKFLDSSTC